MAEAATARDILSFSIVQIQSLSAQVIALKTGARGPKSLNENIDRHITINGR